MSSTEPVSEQFETELAASGNNTGIGVPDGVIERLGGGKRPPVVVDVNGYEHHSTVAVMGGKNLTSFSAATEQPRALRPATRYESPSNSRTAPESSICPLTSQPLSMRTRRHTNSSIICPTVCSGTTLTTSTQPKRLRPGRSASTERSTCSWKGRGARATPSTWTTSSTIELAAPDPPPLGGRAGRHGAGRTLYRPGTLHSRPTPSPPRPTTRGAVADPVLVRGAVNNQGLNSGLV